MSAKRLAIWTSAPYLNDVVFDLNGPLNRDGCLSCYDLLRKRMAAMGWESHTSDVYRRQSIVPDAVYFTSIPTQPLESLLGNWTGKVKLFVFLSECSVIHPQNWELNLHAPFDALFTWADEFVDNGKYYKVNFSNPVPNCIEQVPFVSRKFCAMIAGNKKSSHANELYSERERVIRWFEQNYPQEFDLYGIGWNAYSYCSGDPVWKRLLGRVEFFQRFLFRRYPLYRGTVSEKVSVLKGYKFSVCYENARNVPGYITEKIFDSLYAGCIPVYLGAPDILKHVPEDCFIDRRKFFSESDLYSYMKAMPEQEFNARISAISRFVKKMQNGQFSDHYFAEVVSEVITRKCESIG